MVSKLVIVLLAAGLSVDARQATAPEARDAQTVAKEFFLAFAVGDAAKMKDYFADKVMFVGDLRFLFGPVERSASRGQVVIPRDELITAYTKLFAGVGKQKWAELIKQVQPRLQPAAQGWKHPEDLQGQLPADFAKPGDYVYDLRVAGKTDLDDSILFVFRPVNGKLLIVAHWADY